MMYLHLALGFVLLMTGGEFLVRGAAALAERAGVSALLIGLTLVGFGTSTPELVTSVQAALIGSPGIALGNVVGSNIANILLILGFAGLIMPVAATRKALARDGVIVLATALVATALAATDGYGRVAGAALVAGLIGYLILAYLTERAPGRAVGDQLAASAHGASAGAPAEAPAHAIPGWLAAVLALGGVAMVVFGGRFLVTGAVELARGLGVSETVIGLTIVAVGTSLPELVTSIMAALRKQADIALGNILGSNIYNVLGIAGVTALIAPFDTPAGMLRLDFPVMVGASVLLLVFFLAGRMRMARWQAGLLLAGYAVYVWAVWP